MVRLVAIDGHSLNLGLQKTAQQSNICDRKKRFRIDHHQLAKFLIKNESNEDISLRYYTDEVQLDLNDFRAMGKITKYFANKGYGFITGTDGKSYFFHQNEIINKKVLSNNNDYSNAHGVRYPHPSSLEFRDKLLNKIVSFAPVVNMDNHTNNDEERLKAEELRLELNGKALDKYYQLRREPFLQMLEESGYQIIRCRSFRHSGKSKSVDCRIYLDALCELESDEDSFTLLSDDPIFIDLVIRLLNDNIKVTVATFKISRSSEICQATLKAGGKVVFLDDQIQDMQLEFENFTEDSALADIAENPIADPISAIIE